MCMSVYVPVLDMGLLLQKHACHVLVLYVHCGLAMIFYLMLMH
jgi:hypothetical protein